MDSFFGIPSHPLFVHLPAVLLPLAAIGVVIMVARPAWYLRYRWAVLAVGLVGTLGAVMAASSGESLEESLEGQPETWEAHAESGELARNVALLFVALLAVYVLVPWWLKRSRPSGPTWLMPVLSVLVLAGAVASVITVYDAGHSGAESVWGKVGAADGGTTADGDGDGD